MKGISLPSLRGLRLSALLATPYMLPPLPAQVADSTQVLGRSAQVSVRAYRRLYLRPGHPDQCGVRLELTNVTTRRIGVDLRSYWGAVYPSQWVFTRGGQRDLIDETIAPLSTDTTADRQSLNRAFRAGELTALAPYASMAVFTLFNGRCPGAAPTGDHHYLIFAMVGALRSTDGTTAAELRLTDEPPRARDLVLRLPIDRRFLPVTVRLLLPRGMNGS